MPWKRTEDTYNQSVDPTQLVTYSYTLGKLEIEVQQFFGDVISRGYWGSKQIWFTSRDVHSFINKYFEAVYEGFENQKAKEEYQENVDFCWHCGCVDLHSAEGYVGEEIIYCSECSEVLYAEDAMKYIQ